VRSGGTWRPHPRSVRTEASPCRPGIQGTRRNHARVHRAVSRGFEASVCHPRNALPQRPEASCSIWEQSWGRSIVLPLEAGWVLSAAAPSPVPRFGEPCLALGSDILLPLPLVVCAGGRGPPSRGAGPAGALQTPLPVGRGPGPEPGGDAARPHGHSGARCPYAHSLCRYWQSALPAPHCTGRAVFLLSAVQRNMPSLGTSC